MALYLGQITLFALNFAPVGFASCNGQSLRIADYPALFGLIGTVYGGDGVNTFALPNLQGRVVRGAASGAGIGRIGGTETVPLDLNTMPIHSHFIVGTQAPATTRSPDGAMFAADASDVTDFYAVPGPIVPLSPASMSIAGKGQGHPNMQPFLALNYCIATTGLAPPRSPTQAAPPPNISGAAR